MACVAWAVRSEVARGFPRRIDPVMTTRAGACHSGMIELNVRPGDAGLVAVVAGAVGGEMSRRFARRFRSVVATRAGACHSGMVELDIKPGGSC